MPATEPDSRHTQVAIVGAGFSGIGMAARLLGEGIEDFVILERGEEIGGTWRDNTYPGCQCDIPSVLYSLSFAPNPDWTRAYPLQREIREYLRRCAAELGVMPHVRLGVEMRGAAWDEETRRWRIETSEGERTAAVLVGGTGGLTEPKLPEIPGLESFEGTMFHSARWNHDHVLDGERVAVIGTGASAVQFVPEIQPRVAELHLFQRTPSWVMPDADRAVSEFERTLFRRVPATQRAMRALTYLIFEATVLGTIVDRRLAKALEGVARRHLERQVPDPELRKKLTPNYTIGCKRITMSNTYYGALSAPNAELVTDPISEIRANSIVHGRWDRARDRRDRPRDRVQDLRQSRLLPAPRPRRRHPERGVAGQPARLPRHRRRRLSQSLLPRRAEQRRRLQLDPVHQRGAHQLRAPVPARDGAVRGRDGRGSPRGL